jgi:hypothetical protein
VNVFAGPHPHGVLTAAVNSKQQKPGRLRGDLVFVGIDQRIDPCRINQSLSAGIASSARMRIAASDSSFAAW